MAVFALIAAEHGVGQIAKELGVSRKTIETHSEHIKQKLGYGNAQELKRRARELFGTPAGSIMWALIWVWQNTAESLMTL
jgi:hypothetical protein